MTARSYLLLLLPLELFAQQPTAQQLFHNNCASCHGEDARGSAQGPGLAMNPRVAEQTADQLRTFLERGNVAAGMPSFADLPVADRTALAGFLRNIKTPIPFCDRSLRANPQVRLSGVRQSRAIG
jgi:mono/diheme cytochrome c family protein